jgi:predicted amidohydrolase YtcJ
MAIRSGKIVAVGSDREILEYQSPSTKLIDASGTLGASRLRRCPCAHAGRRGPVGTDRFRIEPNQMGKTKVLMTLVGGKAVYQDPSWGSK